MNVYVCNSYLLWQIVTFDYGKGDENPIDHVRFYRKDNPEKAVIVRKDQVSHGSLYTVKALGLL